jgi:hypothetical protein
MRYLTYSQDTLLLLGVGYVIAGIESRILRLDIPPEAIPSHFASAIVAHISPRLFPTQQDFHVIAQHSI